MAGDARVLLASNRGPVAFTRDRNGELRRGRGAGGVVSALSEIDAPSIELWVCGALTEADRAAAAAAPNGRLDLAGHDTGPAPVRMVDIEPATFDRAYTGIANSTLWFLHHMMFDTVRAPVFDHAFSRDWRAYLDYNAAFADVLAQEAAPRARVVVQDYHLSLVPRLLRQLRPDLTIAHFSHTPWAPPEYFAMLPDEVAADLLEGLLAADRAGFLCSRWAELFVRCCADRLGARVTWDGGAGNGSGAGGHSGGRGVVEYAGHTTRIGVHALGVNAAAMRARGARAEVEHRMAGLRAQIGDRQTIVRVDRAELSKNIVRGLLAYRSLLVRHPDLHGHVVHLVFAYPSRVEVPAYREYAAAVEATVAEIRAEFGGPDWDPIVLAADDDFARSLAAYRIADVAIVNPIRDGMNLVAKELSVSSDNGCALVLSREAGAADQLGEHALLVNPYDIDATADALYAGLTMPMEERRARTAKLAEASAANPPSVWLADQLAALDR